MSLFLLDSVVAYRRELLLRSEYLSAGIAGCWTDSDSEEWRAHSPSQAKHKENTIVTRKATAETGRHIGRRRSVCI